MITTIESIMNNSLITKNEAIPYYFNDEWDHSMYISYTKNATKYQCQYFNNDWCVKDEYENNYSVSIRIDIVGTNKKLYKRITARITQPNSFLKMDVSTGVKNIGSYKTKSDLAESFISEINKLQNKEPQDITHLLDKLPKIITQSEPLKIQIKNNPRRESPCRKKQGFFSVDNSRK